MQRLALLTCVSITWLMSQASATPLDSQGIATDLSFIETQVTKTLTSLGSPTSGYPVSGGDSGTWTTTTPSSGSTGWTTGFFPGQLWLLYQATGSQQWLTAAQAWTAPSGVAGRGSPDRPHGHRLHHRDEFRQRIPADRRPKLQERARHHRQLVGVALQSKCRGASLLDLPSISFSCDHRQHDDAWAVAVGRRQWRQPHLGRNRGDARPDGDHEPRALGRQHVSGRRFRPDDRGALEPGDICRLFR